MKLKYLIQENSTLKTERSNRTFMELKYILGYFYNPQNEMLPFHKTKCSETQNEASSL